MGFVNDYLTANTWENIMVWEHMAEEFLHISWIRKKTEQVRDKKPTNTPKVSLLLVTYFLQLDIYFWNSQHSEASWGPRI